ncbi:MAG: DNA-binding response regulator [Bacillota bacterium]|jgi:DNA-binding LytR/AlgR family response regulator|nr:DNA-binding response regulator [Bacillota bacterium]
MKQRSMSLIYLSAWNLWYNEHINEEVDYMAYNIAVCDDSVEYCEIVAEMIKVAVSRNNINCNLYTYVSGKDLIKSFNDMKFDIIFLDMEMEEINGIDTGLLIREISKDTLIIYLTSHREYAYESYQVKAKDYLLKPVKLNVIERVLTECAEELKRNINYLDVRDVDGVFYRIPINEITHILRKKEDRKLHIYTLDTKEIIIVQTLESIENELTSNNSFARSGKSCIINLENVRAIVKNEISFCNEAVEYASRRCLPILLKKLRIITVQSMNETKQPSDIA